MCGEHAVKRKSDGPRPGSSPHVRGAQEFRPVLADRFGIIPACAGSTYRPCRRVRYTWDHPRMCGEHIGLTVMAQNAPGSSPHVRGALAGDGRDDRVVGIIPACAGSTVFRCIRVARVWDHPRMCGEHASLRLPPALSRGSSPHVRGAHFENSIIPRKRKDNWLFFIQFRFENFLAFRYLLALLHPFLGVPTKDPSFASLGRLINCNPSQSTGDQSAPYTLKAICCSFLAE